VDTSENGFNLRCYMDVSFIHRDQNFANNLPNLLSKTGHFDHAVKPQFEEGKEFIGKADSERQTTSEPTRQRIKLSLKRLGSM